MQPVALALWGEPNRSLSKGDDLRWGSGGSRSVDVKKGTYFDHETDDGGGVLKLVAREKGLSGQDAIAFLKQFGFQDDRRQKPSDTPQKPAGGNQQAQRQNEKRRIVATYDYTDQSGELLYQVVRFEPKTFGQRRPSPQKDGSWIWGLDAGDFMRRGDGADWQKYDAERYEKWRYTQRRRFDDAVPHSLYRVVELREALASGEAIFITEGEKDADNLWAIGVAATTNSGGAKHWSPEHAGMFAGADVVIPVDNDQPGRDRGEAVAASLAGIAQRTRVLDISRFWPGIKEKGDISDWLNEGGGDATKLAGILGQLPAWTPAPPPPFVSKFGAVSWSQMATDAPPHRWLVKNLLTEGELAMIAGGTQCGKTFAALDISMAIARGVPWCDLKVMQGGVIYQAGEDPTGLRTRRLPAYCRANGLTFDQDVDFTLLTGSLNLWNGGDERVADFIAECKALAARMRSPLRLIVIDTYAKATTGADELSGKEMGIVMDRAERIRRETGAAVLLVDHMNADGGRVRGTANKTANIDAVLICRFVTTAAQKRSEADIAVDADGRKIREITNDIKFGGKIKNGDALKKPIRFVLKGVELARDEDGEPITSCIVVPPAGEEIAQAEGAKGKLIGTKLSIAMRALKAAIDAHGRKAPPTVKDAPTGLDCVTLSDWRNALAPMMAGEDEDDETLKERAKKARDRAAEELIVRKYIVKHGDWVWRTGRKVPGLDYVARPAPPSDPPANDVLDADRFINEVPF